MAESRPATVREALAEYYDDLALADRAPGTIRTYRYQLARIPDTPLVDFDRSACRKLMLDSIRTRAPQTSRTYHDILASFARWLCERGYTATNVMDGVLQPKKPDMPAKALSEAQVEALYAAATPDERLLLAFLAGTGLRRTELATARWEDLDCERRTLTVMGKGRKRRTVLVPRDVIAMLSPRPSGLILGYKGNVIWKKVKAAGKRAGIPWLHPHMLRHTYATGYLLRGGSAFHLQTLGGWATDKLIRSRYARAAVEIAALEEARRMEDRAQCADS